MPFGNDFEKILCANRASNGLCRIGEEFSQMLTGLLPTLGFVAAFVGYASWMSKKRAQNQVVASPSFDGFMQQTGYRVAGAAEAPVEEHARKALAAVATMGGPEGQEWVRDCGGEVRHFFRAVTKNNQTYYWCR